MTRSLALLWLFSSTAFAGDICLPTHWKAVLLDTASKAHGSANLRVTGGVNSTLGLQVTLDDVDPGEYLVEIRAVPIGSKEASTFRIGSMVVGPGAHRHAAARFPPPQLPSGELVLRIRRGTSKEPVITGPLEATEVLCM